MTIQIKATEQWFSVVLFSITLYNVVLTFESVDESSTFLRCCFSHSKKVVLTFESVDEKKVSYSELEYLPVTCF